MREARVIVTVLLDKGGLYKTEKYKSPKYIGDPINAIKIFNDKEIDEMCVLDITANMKIEPQIGIFCKIWQAKPSFRCLMVEV